MGLANKTIKFDSNEVAFIRSCFRELSGGSVPVILAVSGITINYAKELYQKLPNDDANFELSDKEWEAIFNLINGNIYGLGPSELYTLTLFHVQDALNLNLKIAHHIFGAYDGAKF